MLKSAQTYKPFMDLVFYNLYSHFFLLHCFFSVSLHLFGVY